ncbi:MAG: CocE/NonD family hydrolase [Mesorhizobium sp.]|nr:CocE/NonD family hydrolase [Mesorhizobium sp.]MCO5159522.1 CocE/NonD family hydrolase [Mesorhizobium sp.]
MAKDTSTWLDGSSTEPGPFYDRTPEYPDADWERDIIVPMRDGVRLCVDICRPRTTTPLPALLAIAPYNKEQNGPEYARAVPPQPSWSTLWNGSSEAGDSKFLAARGYIHVIGTSRGGGKSESGGSPAHDFYDLIEWIAAQEWCDGNVGMIGISAYGASQLQAAAQRPPSLKAIFPYDPGPAFREFRGRNPGGVVHKFPLAIEAGSVAHGKTGQPGDLGAVREAWLAEALANDDYVIQHELYNILTMKGQKAPVFFNILIDPYDTPEAIAKTEASFGAINVPTYMGTGAYAQTLKSHFKGAQDWYEGLGVSKKLMIAGPAQQERPFRGFHSEILRWYDYWLKGIDTGIMNEDPVKVYVAGAGKWLQASAWPLPQTAWTPFYLDSWERLRTKPFTPASRDETAIPDAFVQMPPTLTRSVSRLRYLSEPLADDLLVVGPAAMTLFAEIDQADTNWIIVVRDVGPDTKVRTAREGERDLPSNLPEREVSRGWLKASYREEDAERTKPWRPWHKLTREARKDATPGEIIEYHIELMSMSNLFRRGHRVCVEITAADFGTGIGGATNVEYIPAHVVSSKTVLHKVYRDQAHPSHVLLPVQPITGGAL